MSNYKTLSIIQAIIIIIVGISVFDFGFVFYGDLTDPNNNGIGFNDAIWGGADATSDKWNPIVFWAYGFFVTAILQFLKAFGSDK